MPLNREQARALLARVNPGEMHRGRPLGLRDSAILVLAAAGLSSAEIAALRASAIAMTTRRRVVVSVRRQGFRWSRALPDDLGAHLILWLNQTHLWGQPELLFQSGRGPLTAAAIRRVLARYRNRTRPRKRRRKS